MGKEQPSRAEPGRNAVEVRMPAWLVLALGVWMTLLAAAILILPRAIA